MSRFYSVVAWRGSSALAAGSEKEQIQGFSYSSSFCHSIWFNGVQAPKDNFGVVRGGYMRVGYVVAGAIAVLVIAAGASMIPDLIRYMKIRSM